MAYNEADFTGDAYVVAVNGVPTDIRGTSDLAIRQGKVRKSRQPDATVEIHYAPASAATHLRDGALVVDVTARINASTLLATVQA